MKRASLKRPIAWRIMASAMIAVPFLASSGFAQDSARSRGRRPW